MAEGEPGWFYPPFRAGWTYHGATYGGHSDFSVDWNRRTEEGGWVQDDGDPVLAAADGTVAEVDKRDGLVMVNHYGGLWRTEYRHMRDILVAEGDKVKRGDRLGSIGNIAGDGRSFGSHLHHVHWKRDKVGQPFRRVKQKMLGVPSMSSLRSDKRPDTWDAPGPHVVVGSPRPKPVIPLPERPNYRLGYNDALGAAKAAVAAVTVPPGPAGPAYPAGAAAALADVTSAIDALTMEA